MVPRQRLELWSYALRVRSITHYANEVYGAPAEVWTRDPEIKSFVLYQLSYEHIINKVHFGQAVSYSKTKFEYSAQFISIVFFFGGTMNI